MRFVAWLLALGVVAACSSETSPDPATGLDAGDSGFDAGQDVLEAAADSAVDSMDAPGDASPFAPGDKVLLSAENPDHLDEDPSVILAADDSLHVAYFSHRGGNPDIYVKRSVDAVTWTETRITQDPSGDYFPSLIQDGSGRFHLTWFRWTAFQVGSIWYTSSADGTSWDPEEQVTSTADVDDWTPTIAKTAAGDLLVAFASEKRNPSAFSQLYLARKPAGQAAWQPAAELSSANSSSEDDVLPFVANIGTSLALLWVRCQPGGAAPCLSASSDLFFSLSPEGNTWSAPQQITNDASDDVVDTLPSLYPDLGGNWSLVWLSSRTGTVAASDLPLAQISGYPAAASVLVELAGYSPHVAATPNPAVFIGVWVEQDAVDKNKKDVYYRLFAK